MNRLGRNVCVLARLDLQKLEYRLHRLALVVYHERSKFGADLDFAVLVLGTPFICDVQFNLNESLLVVDTPNEPVQILHQIDSYMVNQRNLPQVDGNLLIIRSLPHIKLKEAAFENNKGATLLIQ